MTTRADVERAARAFKERVVKDEDSAIIAEMTEDSKAQEKEKEGAKGLSLLKVIAQEGTLSGRASLSVSPPVLLWLCMGGGRRAGGFAA
jgi:hypothetical protein